jgi:hypothetical protein
MTETIDQLIQARFTAVANPAGASDWDDVLARARGRRAPVLRRLPARVALAAAVVVLAATVTAVALGLPGRVVDFFEAPTAPQSVKAFFGGHNAALPSGVRPDTKLGQPRKIMTATFDAGHLSPTHPSLHKLYVAPRTGGGFCYIWTRFGGSCADPLNPAKARTDPAARAVGLQWLVDDNGLVSFVTGWVRGDSKTLVAHFADGATAAIPVTWVSAPISAGFFAYVVPPSHFTRADPLTAVVALDANGIVVSRQPFALTKRLDEDVMQTLPDGRKIALPRRAQAARAHELFSFRTAKGGARGGRGRAYLWVMPRTGGGVCFLYGTGRGGGEGCPSRYWLAHVPAIDGDSLNGVFFAQVKPEIATVVLRFRNGSSERITPVDGFVLHAVPSRPVSVVGLSRSGKAIYSRRN